MEIKGKDFGVIGLGKIGSRVAEIATGFGANVYYWSRVRKPECEGKYKFEELDQLITHCDFLSINLALNEQTKNIFDAKRIGEIKRDSVVVNTAPLELFDLAALDKRLGNKDLTYIFDHTDPGDITDEDLNQLRQHENCITYPVLGYISKEAKLALQEIFVENIKSFLKGSPVNKVN
jgi:phosphoglycerate dehydrogenase-like enzyme